MQLGVAATKLSPWGSIDSTFLRFRQSQAPIQERFFLSGSSRQASRALLWMEHGVGWFQR